MVSMGVVIRGMGYGWASIGNVFLAFAFVPPNFPSFKRGSYVSGQVYVYYLAATSLGVTGLYFSNPVEVPSSPILRNFCGQSVSLSIAGGIGLTAERRMSFSINYSGGSRAQAYNVADQADWVPLMIRGIGIGDLSVTSTHFRLLPRDHPFFINVISMIWGDPFRAAAQLVSLNRSRFQHTSA